MVFVQSGTPLCEELLSALIQCIVQFRTGKMDIKLSVARLTNDYLFSLVESWSSASRDLVCSRNLDGKTSHAMKNVCVQ